MNLRDALEGLVFKTKLPQGSRRRVFADVSTEEELDEIVAEQRRALVRAQKRRHYVKHREKIIAKNVAARRKNPNAAAAWRKRWNEKNPEKVRATARRLASLAYKKNPQKYRARQRELYAKNREQRLAYMREYHHRNRERINAERAAKRAAARAQVK